MMGAGRGLKSDFGRSSHLLLTRLQHRKVDRVESIAEFVSSAFDDYCTSEARACNERLDDLSHELSRTGDAATGEKLNKKIHIAEQYLHLAQSRSFVPEAVTEPGFRIVTERGDLILNAIENLNTTFRDRDPNYSNRGRATPLRKMPGWFILYGLGLWIVS